eukprot:2405629-Prymnesium_polylepis.2
MVARARAPAASRPSLSPPPRRTRRPPTPSAARSLHARSQTVEQGVQRYVDVLTGPPTWESGSMPMSGRNGCPCLWGAKGPMEDNRVHAPYLNDPNLNKAVLAKVRGYQARWAASIKPEAMERMKPKEML